MTISNRLLLGAVATALLSTTACTTDPVTGEKRISKAGIGAAIGGVGGLLAGDIVGGKRDRTEKIVGAGLGAIAGGAIGAYMDKQEAELRRKTAGTGIGVERDGDQITLTAPEAITFDFNSSTLKPQFRASLDNVAATLAQYDRTFVDVYGHTDSVGSDAYNQALSERRATTVADYLSTKGVTRARVGTRGFGESQPVASNDSESGRAQNRRVEIKLVPVTDADVRAAS